MEAVIKNKVAESGLLTIDLEAYYPKADIKIFDIKDYLFMGLIVKEKDFRLALQNLDVEAYRNTYVAVTCTADAIIPMWVYMLIAGTLQPVARDVIFGDEKTAINIIFIKNLSRLNAEEYADKRVVVKGCGDVQIPETAYLEITNLLRPYAKTIMYGEPCSTVPIYKKR